ncbi:MAG: ribosome small subunit-dependent GTPase A [Deltaproteobacteria bacterium]|nr:ribosome small subunit-dependent GTPase A [Deltaproteobacteria bacterium]
MKQKKKRSHKKRLKGLVLSVLGRGYRVEVEGEVWHCKVRGRIFLGKRSTHPVVGDVVAVEKMRGEEQKGIICVIEERSSLLSRRAPEVGGEQAMAANIDHVLVCVAVKDPPFRPGLVDRYLVTCEAVKLKPILTLNKIDLISEEELQAIRDEFEALGIEVICTSAKNNVGVEQLREKLKDHRTVFTGPSGAGKSSLLNRIDPTLQLKTGEVNAVTGKGRHTTTVSMLIPVAGGYVMDTPGIREFAPWGITLEDLPTFFSEFRYYLGGCRFRDCQHVAEPDCAVKEAVAEGEISKRRYNSYLFLREELQEHTEDDYSSPRK